MHGLWHRCGSSVGIRALFGLLLLAPVLTLAAGRAGAQDSATITMWFDTSIGSEIAECTIASIIDPYNAQGGIQVDPTLQDNLWQATQRAVTGGAGPDIVTAPGPSSAFEMAEAGQLLALDDIAAQLSWSDHVIPWALDLGRVNGQLFSIPSEIETLVLYYNKTLFEENGWEPPTTLAELTTLAETIDAAGIIPFAHSNREWRAANEWFVGELLNHSAGGPQATYNALTGAGSWTDPAFVEALTMLDQWQQNGWFMGGLDRYYTTLDADRDVAFADGEAAMKIEGTWWVANAPLYFGEEAGNESDWDWVPVPSASGDVIFDLGIGMTFSINANSENPEAAAEFLTYYFSPETQATLAVECGLAPAPVTIPPEDLSGLDPRYAAMLAALDEVSRANNYSYTTWTFLPPKSNVYIYEEIEKVWAGDMTVEEYLQGLQTLFDEEKADGDIQPIPAR